MTHRDREAAPSSCHMSTVTTNVLPQLSLADSIAITRLRLQVMEREQEMLLPYATDEQVAQIVAAAESFEAVKVKGLNVTFRLSESQKEQVKDARHRHATNATARKEEIGKQIAGCTAVTRYKYKASRDGKITGTVNFTL